MPELQRPVVGALLTVELFAEPHTPLTAVTFSDAEHWADVPPPVPLQFQLNGPLPVTNDAVPAVHRLPVGMLVTVVLLAEPQAPLTGVTTPLLEPLLEEPELELPELDPVTPELELLPDELELPLEVLEPPDELDPVVPELELPVTPELEPP